MSVLHCWDVATETILDVEVDDSTLSDVPLEAHLCFLVDSRVDHLQYRYGMYYVPDDGTGREWLHIPPEKFPLQFRAALLIRGIT